MFRPRCGRHFHAFLDLNKIGANLDMNVISVSHLQCYNKQKLTNDQICEKTPNLSRISIMSDCNGSMMV